MGRNKGLFYLGVFLGNEGFVLLWRKTLDKGLLKHPVVWQVFGFCLMSAMWKQREHLTKEGVLNLKPGQFVTGRKVMARELSQTEDKIRTALKMLSTMEIITIKTTNKFSVITLRNWDKYQNIDFKNPTKIPNKAPTDPQQSPTKEQGNHSTIKEYTDCFYARFEARYGQKPSPSKGTFRQLSDKIKSGLPLDEWKARTEAYFKASWPPEKDMQGLLSNWDKFAKKITKPDSMEGLA